MVQVQCYAELILQKKIDSYVRRGYTIGNDMKYYTTFKNARITYNLHKIDFVKGEIYFYISDKHIWAKYSAYSTKNLTPIKHDRFILTFGQMRYREARHALQYGLMVKPDKVVLRPITDDELVLEMI